MRAWQLSAGLCAVFAAGCVEDPNLALVEPSAVDIVEGKVGDAKIASLLRVAAASEASGDYANAAGLYRSAYRLTANEESPNPEPLVGLGRSLAVLGALDEAVEAFRAALEIRADDPETRRLLGNVLVKLGLGEAAKTQYALAIDAREDARTYNGLGVANDMSGDHLAAQAHYRAGLELEPGNLALRNNLGLSLAVIGKFDEGIELLRRAAADPRAGARQRNNLALAYGLAGRTEAAARINRIHQDRQSTDANLSYYRTLRALRDTRQTVGAVGVHVDAGSRARSAGLPFDPIDRVAVETGPEPAGAPTERSENPALDATPPAVSDTTRQAPKPVATGAPVALATVGTSDTEGDVDGDVVGDETVFDAPVADQHLDEPVMTLPPSEDPAVPVTVRMPGGPLPSARLLLTDREPGRYVVQFAAYLTRERAAAGWQQISRAAAQLLDGIRPDVQPMRLTPASAPHYRLRSQPLAGKHPADALCRSLERRGIDCLVIRQAASASPSSGGEGAGGSARPELHPAVQATARPDPDDVFSP